ncbi:MAG: glycosyltransferase family 39 protein [Myxococcaceae bacterium]
MRARLLVLGLAALCLSIDCARHVDDSDASLYTVVARHLVEDGSWTQLRYLDDVHPVYREHLPFGVWPLAATIRVFGEAALPWTSALWTLLTIALVIELGARWKDLDFGVRAGLLLATTERFIAFGALPRLDPALIFFSLGACVPFVLQRRDLPALVLAVVSASIACLIKGPFGLVLPLGAALAVAVSARDWRWLGVGALVAVLAVLPVALFLWRSDDSWLDGYLRAQLLASATGARVDGETAWWFPFWAVGALFWPWLPLSVLALWLGRKQPFLAAWSLAVLVALALAGRKLPHHVLLAFPVLALLAASSLEHLPRLLRDGLLGLCFLIGPAATWLNPPPRAAVCTTLADTFRALPAGTRVAVVADPAGRHWRELATLARDYRLRPLLIATPELKPVGVAGVLRFEDEWRWSP